MSESLNSLFKNVSPEQSRKIILSYLLKLENRMLAIEGKPAIDANKLKDNLMLRK